MAQNDAMVFVIAAATEFSSATLTLSKIAPPPSSLAIARPAASLRSNMATRPPAAAIACATAPAIPEAPPGTKELEGMKIAGTGAGGTRGGSRRGPGGPLGRAARGAAEATQLRTEWPGGAGPRR